METKPTELARLYRPVPESFFPDPSIIATLDRDRNIVFFNLEVYEQLDAHGRRQVLALDAPYLELR